MPTMSFINKFLFVVLATLTSVSTSLEEFYCKAVDGCEINARCDPSPFSWAYLKRNDFPIKCVSDDASKEKYCEDKVKALESKVENLTEVINKLQKDKKTLEDGFVTLRKEFESTTIDIAQLKDEIANIQDQNITKVINILQELKNNTEAEISNLKMKTWRLGLELEPLIENHQLKEFCTNHNGILYNGSCLWEEDRPGNMTLVNAYRKCNSVTPSKLPEFYNEEQYNQLMGFLRSKIPNGETYIHTWIALTRNHWTGKAVLSNGELVPYDVKVMRARDQWVDGSLQRTNAYLDARNYDSDFSDMGALSPSYIFDDKTDTLLCQTLPFSSEPKFISREDEVWCQYIGGIAYNGSCLWAEDPPDDMTLSRALEVCNKITPSKLPEVYGGHQYIEIMEYMRTKIKTTYILAWTAMTRNITTNQAMLSDGTPAPYTKGRTSVGRWEDATDNRANVYLLAKVSTTDNDQGMGAIWPTHGFEEGQKLVICQKL